MASDVCGIVTGHMGSGKSLFRGPVYACEEFLPEHDGLLITNIPLHRKRCAKYVADKYGKDAEEIERRIVIIPRELHEQWMEQKGDPAGYLREMLENNPDSHVILDEAHQYFPKGAKVSAFAQRFVNFCSTVRHNKSRIELITQSEKNLHPALKNLAAYYVRIIPKEHVRLPYIGISIGDLYEIWGGIGRLLGGMWGYESYVVVATYNMVDGKLEETYRRSYIRSVKYFKLYDSHGAATYKGKGDAPEEGDPEADDELPDESERPMYEYQKRNFPSLILWFVKRNLYPLTKCGVIAAVLVWFLYMGGLSWLAPKAMGLIQDGLGKNMVKPVATGAKTAGDKTESKSVDPKPPDKPKKSLEEVHKDALARMAQLQAEISQQKKDAEKQERQRKQLEDVRDVLSQQVDAFRKEKERASEIVLMDHDGVMLRNGEYCRVGSEIQSGDYKGMKLERVDYAGKRAYLDDGIVLSLRGLLEGRKKRDGRENPTGGTVDQSLPVDGGVERPDRSGRAAKRPAAQLSNG